MSESTHVEPRRTLRAWLHPWGTWLVLLGAVLLLVHWARRPPPPRGRDAPATEFSEERALPLLLHLTQQIGPRATGTEGAERSARFLEEQLRAIPGLEVQVQEHHGQSSFRDARVHYWLRNVLARLPGETNTALLVSAHYDSAPGTVGASDNALAVAAVVELARALAAGPRPHHTLVFNLGGSEETALLGATAFLEHPWMGDVRAFVNLDAMGARGKVLLFQAPSGTGLLERYQRGVPHPFANVAGQDVFQLRLIPSRTEFQVYHSAARAGLDLALFEDGYAYHTPLDQPARLEPGALQHVGDTTLALVRALAQEELPPAAPASPAVYYDVLGWGMLVYSADTAAVLALVTLVLTALALGLCVQRGLLTWGGIGRGLGLGVATLLSGVLAVSAVALSLPLLFRRPHGWYSAPWLAVLCFGALALAAALGIHARFESWSNRRGLPPERRALEAGAGGLVLSALLLVAAGAAHLGSGYVLLWWALPSALLLAWVAYARRPAMGFVFASLVPGTVVTLQLGAMLLDLLVPLAGRSVLPVSYDPPVALVIALPALACLMGALPAFHLSGRLGSAARASAAVGGVFLLGLLVMPPYEPQRPKRLWVDHLEENGLGALVVRSADFLEPEELATGLGGAPRRRGEFGLEAPALPLERARVELLESVWDDARGMRRVSLRVVPGAHQPCLQLTLPKDSGAHWLSSSPVPGEAFPVLLLYAPPPEGVRVSFDVPSQTPIEVTRTEFFSRDTAELKELRARLPAWTTSMGGALRVSTERL